MNKGPLLLHSAFLLSALAAFATDVTRSPAIRVEEVLDHGQSAYRIATPAGTWIYHRDGAGFSSLLDPQGRDWISYRPKGGAAGHFRGIPNAVFRLDQKDDNFFHPGHAGPKTSVTTLVASGPDRVLLRSKSRNGRWVCEWEILPDRARIVITKMPVDGAGYWFLFEGTPGGHFSNEDLCLRPGGKLTKLADAWEDSMQTTPWTAFISPGSGYSLLLIAHNSADIPVCYWPMENAMTVFGFGRKLHRIENLLTAPFTFTVELLAVTDPTKVAERADFRLRNL